MTPISQTATVSPYRAALLLATVFCVPSSAQFYLAANVSTSLPSNPSAARQIELEARLARAQERVQAGKRLLQEGNPEGARTAFDQAVEALLDAPVALEERARLERKLEDIIDLIYKYDVDQLGAGDPSEKSAFDRSPLDDIREKNFPLDPKLKDLVQHQISSTQSKLPLDLNDSILSFVSYFANGKGRNTLIAGWRRSHRYRPMIERILQEEGVPQELLFLAQAESGFLPRAVSYKAACGMWQFVSFRGKEYGLSQSPLMDLRLDPEKATRAAARHLRDLYQQFGDWHLAMAAYNCGPGCVSRAIERTGYADYWQLRRLNALPKETANYVPIILALTIVTKNADQYGIELNDPEPAMQYETLTLDSPTHLDLIADAADLPVGYFRDLNPALLRSIAPAGYELRVPLGLKDQVAQGVTTIPVNQRASWRLHRVKPGDSLTEIAQRYRTTAKSIAAANRDAEQLNVGSVLIVPASYTEPARAAKPVLRKVSAGRAKAKTAVKSQARPRYRTAGRRAAN